MEDDKYALKVLSLVSFVAFIALILIGSASAYTVNDFVKPESYEGSLHKACRGNPPPKNSTSWTWNGTDWNSESVRGGWRTGDEFEKVDGQYLYCLNKIDLCNPTNVNFSTDSISVLNYGYMSAKNVPKGMSLYEVDNEGFLVQYKNSGGYIDKQSCKKTYLAATKNNPTDTLEWWVNLSGNFLDPLWNPAPAGLNLLVYYAIMNNTVPITDDSGNGRNSTTVTANFISNSPLKINGSNAYYEMSSSSANERITVNNSGFNSLGQNGYNYSVVLLFNSSSANEKWLITKFHSQTTNYPMDIRIQTGGNLVFRTKSGGSVPTTTGSVNVNDGKYHLAVFKRNSEPFNKNLTIYVDGKVDITENISDILDTSNTAAIYIGNRSDGIDNPFIGQVKEFRIYNYALTNQQIVDLWNALGSAPNLTSLGFNQTDYGINENIAYNFTYLAGDNNSIGQNADYGNITVNWFRDGTNVKTQLFNLTAHKSVINATLTTIEGSYSVGDNITINVTAIDQRNKSASPIITATTQISNDAPTFNQSMTDIAIRINTNFFRRVNCTDTEGNAINYSTNTSLVLINNNTGIINITGFTDAQIGNYSINVSCNDAYGRTTSSFNLDISRALQFFWNNNQTNFTAYETTNQTFYVNLTYNTSAFNISSMFIYNNTKYNLTLSSTRQSNNSLIQYYNDLQYNESLYRANLNIPLIDTNTTNWLYNFNITLLGISTNETHYYNDSQNILYAYSFTGIQRTNPKTEGSNSQIIFNISKQTEAQGTINTVIFEYNRTNFTGTQISSSSTLERWEKNVTIPLINSVNETKDIYSYYSLTFGGSTKNRTGLNTTQLVRQFFITNCSNGNQVANSLTTAINYSILDETTNNLISVSGEQANSQALFTTNAGNFNLNKTFSFNYNNKSLPIYCIYPPDDTTLSITTGTIQYSAIGYSTRYYYHDLFNISSTQTKFNLYLLSASSGSTEVGIQILNQNNNNVQNAIIKAHKYTLATNNYTLVDTETTAINGIGNLNLQLNETYRFDIWYQNELKTSAQFPVTTTLYTIRIIIGSITSPQGFIDVRNITKTLTCNNNTRDITFTWNDANNLATQYCLGIFNTTAGFNLLNQSCSTNNTGTITFTNVTNSSVITAVTKAKSSKDSLFYLLKEGTCTLQRNPSMSARAPFGLGGVLIALILFGTITSIGVYTKSSHAILLAIPAIEFINVLQLFPITYPIRVGVYCVLLIIYFLMR